MANTESIGDRLRRLREAAGLTQAELADAAGVARPSVNEIETGVTAKPRRGTLSKLATRLGVSVDVLQGSDGRALSPAPVERPATTAAPVTDAPQAGRGPMLTPEQAAEVLIELANAKGHIARLESAVEYQEEIIADLRADKALLQRAHFGYAPPATDAPQSDAPESLPGKVESDSYAAGQERKYIGGQHRDPETGNVLLFSINPGLMAEQAAHLVRGARHFTLPLPDSATGPESTVKQA